MPPKLFEQVTLDHIVLRTSDADGLVDFYQRVLGASVERTVDSGLIQLRLGSIIIDITPADSELGRAGGPPPSGGRNMDHFCLRVEPFDEVAIRRHLNGLGVELSATAERYGADGYGPSVYVTDPDGNTVELKGAPVRGPESSSPDN